MMARVTQEEEQKERREEEDWLAFLWKLQPLLHIIIIYASIKDSLFKKQTQCKQLDCECSHTEKKN